MSTETELVFINDQLQILESYHLLAGFERQQIIEKLKKEPQDQLKLYSESIYKGLPGVTKGLIAAVKAGKGGDPVAISMATFDIFAGVMTMAGPLLGPAGPILSALASAISTILGEFLPKAPSVKEELEKLLDKFLAEEKLRKLSANLDALWVLSDTIENHYDQNSKYDLLDLQHGPEVRAIDDVWQWLLQEDKQSVPEWDGVLEKICITWVQLMRCVTLSVLKPSTKKDVDTASATTYVPARQEIFLKHLRTVKPVARARGLYAWIVPWTKGNILYVARGDRKQKVDLQGNYKKNTGWIRNISIIVPKNQWGSSKPQYDLIECDDKLVSRHQLDSFEGNLTDGKDLLKNDTAYPNIQGGGTRDFVHCVSAWALTDFQDPNSIRIYTAHSSGIGKYLNYVNVHKVDSKNVVTRENWQPNAIGGKFEHIRAIVSDISDSLPDDPDVAELTSRQYEIIYAGYNRNPNVWVELDNNWKDVPSPWTEYNGIEVDPNFLWVFGKEGIACATHASVIKCKNGKLDKPRWITYKTNWEDGFNVKSLCASADGVLSICSDQSRQSGLVLWQGDYKINLKESKLTWSYSGHPLQERPEQIIKTPAPCWAVFESLWRSLEEQVGKSQHI